MKILIFGGTTEGRKLSSALAAAGIDVVLSVATGYGREPGVQEAAHLSNVDSRKVLNSEVAVIGGKLECEEMTDLIERGSYEYVIDATHPYAVLATENIRRACVSAGVKRLKMKRPMSLTFSGIEYVPDAPAAVKAIGAGGGAGDAKVFLAVGSKELEHFTSIQNYAERCFVRILPMKESLDKALALGFRGSNIICMQGPFSEEMNIAMFKMTGAEYLITKDSGDAGGFEEKVSAALSLGCKVIVIERPAQEEGYTYSELLDLLGVDGVRGSSVSVDDAGLPETTQKETRFFPVFIDLKDKKALIAGGGNVAGRRAASLCSFGADVTVLAPEVSDHIAELASQGSLHIMKRAYQKGDIYDIDPFLVIAATDDRQTNHDVMTEAVNLGVHISVADCREECTFFFPAICESESYIAGLVSKNGDHSGVKQKAGKIRRLLDE